MSQEDLAQRAKVSLSTVRDFEKEDREPIANNIEAMQRVFEEEGMTFSSDPHGVSGMRYEGRIKERDTYLPTLEILDDQPNGFIKTSDLIRALEIWFNPKGENAEILEGRSDTRFSQIVRNIVSHRETPTNIIGAGWVKYDKVKRGLHITLEGRRHLVAEQERMKI